jgi:two-component system LytT family sensor kinase
LEIVLRILISLVFDFIFIVLLFSVYFLIVSPASLSHSIHFFYMALNTIIFATVGLFIYQGYQGELELARRKAREKELEELAARSQLVALRAQINPHFLFNALNSIAELIKTDPDRAEQSVLLLADIFRHSLNIADTQFVTLAEEIRFIEAYLAIEKIRFGDRLRVEIEVDPQLVNLSVPSLILQPLVENAIKHGISRKAEGGQVRITATDRGSSAMLSVSDSGKGIPEKQLQTIFDNSRIGLRNVKERLVKIYGDHYRPQIESSPGVGTKITIYVPKGI